MQHDAITIAFDDGEEDIVEGRDAHRWADAPEEWVNSRKMERGVGMTDAANCNIVADARARWSLRVSGKQAIVRKSSVAENVTAFPGSGNDKEVMTVRFKLRGSMGITW
jgi:hypothetical protein